MEINIDAGQHELNLEQFFGVWSVESSAFSSLIDTVQSLDLAKHIQAAHSSGFRPMADARREKQIAVVNLNGTLTKRGSSLNPKGSSVLAKQAIRQAARDEEVGGILLVVDSPGGTVSGTVDLANEVKNAAKEKPVYAFVEDLAASAAYWVVSQCDKVYANNTMAAVGSIGTFLGLYDRSAAAAMQGIRAIVIKSGEFKASGFAGSEITTEQIEHFQNIVDATQAEFEKAVASGRKLSSTAVAELADGRLFLASDALASGLIDGIKTYKETFTELQELTQSRGFRPMSDKQQAATYQDLKACLPGADADFICSQMEANATLDQAQSAWMEEQNRRIEVAEADAEKAKQKPQGVEPVPTGSNPTKAGSAIDQWNAEVKEKMTKGYTKAKAISMLTAEQPELHREMLAEYNANRR